MALITNSDVFEFVGAPSDVQTQQGTMVTNLITRVQKDLEDTLGRKLEETTYTDLLFEDGLNCEIFDEWLFLKGIYRDTYEITTLTETGVTLTAVTDYNDGNDYYLDTTKGAIKRHNQNWSKEPFAIKITGKTRLGGSSAHAGVKQILIELVAAQSGLWKLNVETEGGDITQIRTTPSDQTMKELKKYILKDIV